MLNLEDFGRRLKLLRQQRGLSQAALGRRLNISQKEISHYETNYRTPPVEIIPRLAEALGTTAGALYGEPAQMWTDAGLKKSTIWLIAERLEDLDESERGEVLAFIDRMIAGKKDRKED